MSGSGKPDKRILVVRLGAMGDVLHTLPAVTALKQNHPNADLTWLVEPRWMPLLEDNPYVDRVIPLRRGSLRDLIKSWRELRSESYDLALDFQGLLKSAIAAKFAGPARIVGFHESQLRERMAGLFYAHKVSSSAAHVVDRNLDLVLSCGRGAESAERLFPLPAGCAEGELPLGDFVLASPLAGWGSKQWPMEHYQSLAQRLKRELGIPMVLNGAPGSGLAHVCGLSGLIHATRRAVAVVGVDSGPMHLAAALGK